MEPRLLTIPDFVSIYRISRTAVYREIAADRLQITKVGKRTYIATDDAETWLKAARQAS